MPDEDRNAPDGAKTSTAPTRARMAQSAALVAAHAKRGGKRACYCCTPATVGKQLRRTQRRIEKQAFRKAVAR